MLIKASTKSRHWRRGADKKVAQTLGIECSLSSLVGRLELDATTPADIGILNAIYQHVFGYLDKNSAGSIIVLDAKGTEVGRYSYPKKVEEAQRG
jgi:hypothetical protein